MTEKSMKMHKLMEEQKGREFSPKFFETESGMGKFQRIIHLVTTIFEVMLSIVLVSGILVSSVHIPEYFTDIIKDNSTGLRELINYVAIIIIIIELIHVLNLQNLKSVIEILMLAFTRELVIRDWAMWQLLIGVVCIAGLFATRKYLMHRGEDEF